MTINRRRITAPTTAPAIAPVGTFEPEAIAGAAEPVGVPNVLNDWFVDDPLPPTLAVSMLVVEVVAEEVVAEVVVEIGVSELLAVESAGALFTGGDGEGAPTAGVSSR